VVELDGDEHHAMVWFRDRLRGDAALRQRYEARKQSILAMGINDALEYCKAKGDFVTEVLKQVPYWLKCNL
jgi:GrpB-like predicted nucleotidyltransferase (UPF0157 family)